ncbi:hypothetical protein EXIGLDRAFT_744947 [Exidia glandulosa HHB12029]|uniref:Uncharacterized protein n=1 Tax=Exidia glandulosa HHB12029 TaxID=1314781 RepID=A0A165PAX8_EXIGL|nr:hypothetical protein EXIGLDRAFT_744947 [Exidia glandulosa HHB12029]
MSDKFTSLSMSFETPTIAHRDDDQSVNINNVQNDGGGDTNIINNNNNNGASASGNDSMGGAGGDAGHTVDGSSTSNGPTAVLPDSAAGASQPVTFIVTTVIVQQPATTSDLAAPESLAVSSEIIIALLAAILSAGFVIGAITGIWCFMRRRRRRRRAKILDLPISREGRKPDDDSVIEIDKGPIRPFQVPVTTTPVDDDTGRQSKLDRLREYLAKQEQTLPETPHEVSTPVTVVGSGSAAGDSYAYSDSATAVGQPVPGGSGSVRSSVGNRQSRFLTVPHGHTFPRALPKTPKSTTFPRASVPPGLTDYIRDNNNSTSPRTPASTARDEPKDVWKQITSTVDVQQSPTSPPQLLPQRNNTLTFIPTRPAPSPPRPVPQRTNTLPTRASRPPLPAAAPSPSGCAMWNPPEAVMHVMRQHAVETM